MIYIVNYYYWFIDSKCEFLKKNIETLSNNSVFILIKLILLRSSYFIYQFPQLRLVLINIIYVMPNLCNVHVLGPSLDLTGYLVFDCLVLKFRLLFLEALGYIFHLEAKSCMKIFS